MQEQKQAEIPQNNVIFEYSRRQAIDDGVLVEEPIETLRKGMGFSAHCVLTEGLYSRLDLPHLDMTTVCFAMLKSFRDTADLEGRKLLKHGEQLVYTFPVGNSRFLQVKVVAAFEDYGLGLMPCFTFMLPNES